MTDLAATGVSLAAEHATSEAVGVLRDSGIRPIVLKGPAQVRWLYGADTTREVVDVDILVAPGDVPAAEEALEREGYRLEADTTPGVRLDHGVYWSKPGKFSIDLHWCVAGADPAVAYGILSDHRESIGLAGRSVEILDEAGRCFVAAVHAAQHGTRNDLTRGDLEQACEVADLQTWEVASVIAREAGAEQAFAAGLSLVPTGRSIAATLQLNGGLDPRTALALATAPDTGLGYYWLAQQRGFAKRARFVLHKLIPPVAFMRDWRPIARRGRRGLVLAYVYRLFWLAWWAPHGYLAWRRAKRASRGA